MKREIRATKEGLIEHLRDLARQHTDSAGSAPTQRRKERQLGIAEGLEIAARALADTTFVQDETDD